MSELKSRPPGKTKANLEAFISGAEQKAAPVETVKPAVFPWQEEGIRDDVTKVYNLRLSEPYFLKLKYISEHSPQSMQKFCLTVLEEAIDKEIEQLINDMT